MLPGPSHQIGVSVSHITPPSIFAQFFSEQRATGQGRGGTHATLDARGLNCPLPVLKARKALKGLPPGGVLEVLATDPASVIDFRHFCDTNRCELLDSGEAEGVFTFRIRNAP